MSARPFLAALCPVTQAPPTALTWAEGDTAEDTFLKPVSTSPSSPIPARHTPTGWYFSTAFSVNNLSCQSCLSCWYLLLHGNFKLC